MGNSKGKDEGGGMKDEGVGGMDSPSSFIPHPSSLVDSLFERTREALASLGVTKESSLLVAVSGGPDSLALLHVMQALRGAGVFESITVAHVNHGLRKTAAKREEVAVRKYCDLWNVPFEVKHVPTERAAKLEKTGIEETARKLRYQFFEELIQKHGFDFVLTAHTANDQAETVILNMVRGSGVRGLAGIPAKRKLGSAFVIRPWLNVTKDEILEYLREQCLTAEHDASNEELTYQRNRVRHKVLPVLAEVWPDRSTVKALAGLAGRMRELSKFLDLLTQEKLELLRKDGGLSLDGLKELHGFPFHAVIEGWINEEFGRYGLTSDEARRIETWLVSSSPAMELRKGVRLKKDRQILRLRLSK